MKKSFEEKLIDFSGEAELKGAKQLLKQNRLCGAWHESDGRLSGRFRLPGGNVDVSVKAGDPPAGECSCRASRSNAKRLCEHGVALIMYAGRFKLPPAVNDEEAASYYGGLRRESLQALIEKTKPPLAQLSIDAVSAFPHVPSKWENATLSVKLRTREREYLGNLNNLRQLYFDKSLTVTLKFEQFSLQEQQIIRFLAINGEADNSQILLNAEMTAEFFHCLIDFPRFTREGRQLQVRGDFVLPVLIRSAEGRSTRLSPGIRIGTAALPTAGAKVITGRAGCWIGREGEYFFVPATNEISWLRNFFRSSVLTPPEGVTVNEFLQSFPLPVVNAGQLELENREANLLLDGEIPVDNRFVLRVRYLYETGSTPVLLHPATGRLVREDERFWRRDEQYERLFENELALFGFIRGETGDFLLEGADRIGTFLDRALPTIMAARPGVTLSGRLAAQLRGADGLPQLMLNCRLEAVKPASYLVGYTLAGAGTEAQWKSCQDAIRDGGDFLILPGAGMVKIGTPLQNFFRAANNALRALDPLAHTFEVPFYAAEYYTALVREIPGALLPEIAAGPVAAAELADVSPGFRFEGTLRGYQQEGVAFLQRMTDRGFNVILADEMGLGKTVQLLALLASRKRRDANPALIVCPASLVENWAREAAKFVPDFRVAAPTGTERGELWKHVAEYDLIILSYTAARLSADKLRHFSFSYLVLDEAQHIKNPGSSNAKNCKSIDAVHRIVLSGTPLENSPEDLWSIMDFLHPGMLGTLPAFRRYYADIRTNPTLQDDLAARVRPFIKRRTKAAVATDLPPKSEHVLYCEMDHQQRALYEQVLDEGRKALKQYEQGDARGNALVFRTLLRLRQICCHPALLPDHQGDGIPSAKMELLLELLHENIDSHHKMLLFSQFTSLLALAIPELERDGIPFEYLDGATRNRQQRVDHFNNTPELPLFLLSLKAGGTGLNLTSADTVIIYDPWWNPAVELQAADRTHRIGQSRPVSAVKLVVKDSIEEKILKLQAQKQEVFDAVIDNPAAAVDSLNIEDLKLLLAP